MQRHIAGSKENTKFTYDGEDVLMDDDSGSVTKYLNGPGIDNKLRSTNGSTASYFLADHLGSTNGLTNAAGSLTASNSYDGFGNATNSAFPSRYQFTGREFDNFTGLQFSRARFYDPNLGRFISEDPIGFGGGDVNLYGYVWNNPGSFTDPLGLDGWGNDLADQFDGYIDFARLYYQGDLESWGWNGSVNTVADMAGGFADIFRCGSGAGQAYYSTDENGYGRAAFGAMDVGRCSALFGALAGAFGRFTPKADFCPVTSTKIHGNDLNSQRPTWGYKLHEDNGKFLKNGITSEPIPENRYTKGYMSDKYMDYDPTPFPNRRTARTWERNENTTNPGPLNKRK